jgi:hypothetical protein
VDDKEKVTIGSIFRGRHEVSAGMNTGGFTAVPREIGYYSSSHKKSGFGLPAEPAAASNRLFGILIEMINTRSSPENSLKIFFEPP